MKKYTHTRTCCARERRGSFRGALPRAALFSLSFGVRLRFLRFLLPRRKRRMRRREDERRRRKERAAAEEHFRPRYQRLLLYLVRLLQRIQFQTFSETTRKFSPYADSRSRAPWDTGFSRRRFRPSRRPSYICPARRLGAFSARSRRRDCA